MKNILFYSLIIAVVFSSCSNEDTTKEKQEGNASEQSSDSGQEITPEEATEENWETITVLEGGFRLGMKIPNEKVAGGKSDVKYLEDRGELEVRVGNNFDIFLLEDQSQIELVKNELNDHAFFKVELKVVNDSSLLYRQYTEDSAKDQWHMYAERNIGSSKIIVRSNEAIPFSEYQAKLMLQSALSITPIN